MVTRIAAVLLVAAALSGRADPRPAFTVEEDGVIAASFPVEVLRDASVKKQLASGLTTTFFMIARAKETRSQGAARVEIRYDLWDEVWLVRRIERDRKVQVQRIESIDALEKWWHGPVRLLAGSGKRVSLQIDLTVLPFSAAEEEDAREWMSKSGGVGTAGSAGAGLVDVLIGTTISAKPITSYRWNIFLELR